MKKKHRLVGKLSQPNSKKCLLKGCIEKLSKTLDQTPEAFHFDDSNLEMENCTTETRAHP